jgi:pimeloyl-ACP methyl ester carboxylesterase
MATGAAAQGQPLSGRRPLFSVESTDGVSVAVHELSTAAAAPPLLISHATGFCGHAYAPFAAALGDRFRSLALDHRGHGATLPPGGWEAGEGVDWRAFGDDTLAVARAIGERGRLVGFGHSMGGSSLLMAAHREPSQFSRLVLFEPIARPPDEQPVDATMWPIVVGARRRTRHFASFQAAFENFRRKPPLSDMTADALQGYVEHGLRPAREGGVELCCTPELEAAIFVLGPHNGVWDLLPDVDVPVLVVSGAFEPDQPSASAAQIAERLPRGELVVLPDQGHLGPFSHPTEVADVVSAFL